MHERHTHNYMHGNSTPGHNLHEHKTLLHLCIGACKPILLLERSLIYRNTKSYLWDEVICADCDMYLPSLLNLAIGCNTIVSS